ncbi:MAG: four helix bundle protein [Myxococcota bacterium]
MNDRTHHQHPGRFYALEYSLDFIRLLRPLVQTLERHDKCLAKQLRNAASSVALNLAEGRRRAGKDRTHFWRIAAGSADEARTCLRVAESWGYLAEDDSHEALEPLDRVLAITWRLTH